MADLSYKVTVDTKQAESALNGLNAKLGNLRSALSGLAIGAFIANTYRSAQAAKDLSDQTGLALQSIIGLRKAFQESGSSAEAADTAMLKLAKNIGEAKTGNDELAIAFQNLGVNVYDATATLDEQALRVVEGLGRIKDQSVQTATAIQVLGKGGAAAFSQIGASARGYVAGSLEAANATIAADAASEKFEEAITNIQTELLKVLKPLNAFIADVKLSGDEITNFIKKAAAIGGLILAFTTLGKVLGGLRTVFNLITGGFGLIKKGGESLAKTWELIVWQFNKFRQAGEFTSATANGIVKRFKFLSQGVNLLVKGLGVLAAAIGTVFAYFMPDAVLQGFKELGQMMGLVKSETEKLADEQKRLSEEQAEKLKKEIEEQAELAAQLQKKVEAIREIGKAYQDANIDVLENLDNELEYITMTERQAEVAKAVDSIYKNQSETVKKLQKELEKLPQGETVRRQAIEETIATINRDTAVTVEGVQKKIQALQSEREEIEARNRAIEFGEQLRKDVAALAAMQAEIDMIGMSTEEREIYQDKLKAEADLKERLADIDLEAARAGNNATQSQIDDWNKRRQAAIDYYDIVLQKQDELRQAQDDQSKALKQWSEDTQKQLEDSVKPAENIKRFWNTLENQIDDFVKTGKFSIKQFLASVVQEFIAAQLKLAALNFLKSIGLGSGGGLFGGSIIPGLLAEGGPAKANKPYIVGEEGPELFVPRSSGTVIPNNQMSKGVASGAVSAPVTNNYITNNISAVDAKSVAQLFAENRKTLLGSVKMAEKELPYMA